MLDIKYANLELLK
jgi:hypothetical protein